MVGIRTYGTYVPVYRLTHEEIAKAWRTRAGKGERAVAAKDEDSLTMAVEAAVDCLGEVDRNITDGLFFASTTSPFLEKQVATSISCAADLRRDISTADFSGSLKAGTSAILAAMNSVAAGANNNVLVTIADCRLGHPGSSMEYGFGDGAVSFMISNSDVGLQLEGIHSNADEITDYWRQVDDRYVHAWEERFVLSEGFMRVTSEAVNEAFKKFNLTSQDIAKFVTNAPSERAYWQLAKKLGFNVETQVAPPMYSSLGNIGAAMGPMQLVSCMETANPGDLFLMANYGNGCDVMLLKATDKIAEAGGKKGLQTFLSSKKMISNYQQYALFREIIPKLKDRMPPIRPPATTLWRDQNSLMRFYGSKCNQCGHVQYPIHRVCSNCGTIDDYTEIRLSDKIASVYSCTIDSLGYGAGVTPFWAIADFEEVRARLEIADAELEEVKVGDSLEMTFRKLPSENDVPVYGWKARLIR